MRALKSKERLSENRLPSIGDVMRYFVYLSTIVLLQNQGVQDAAKKIEILTGDKLDNSLRLQAKSRQLYKKKNSKQDFVPCNDMEL